MAVNEKMGDRISKARHLAGSLRVLALTTRQFLRQVGQVSPGLAGRADDAVQPDFLGEGDGAPPKGSLGELYGWLLTCRDERIDISRFLPSVQTALSRNLRCWTWGDLAAITDDDLRATAGIGDGKIAGLHLALEIGLAPSRYPLTSDLKLSEKYEWLAAVAEEPIDMAIFDRRSQTAFEGGDILTWGDLGALTDVSLGKIPHVGALTVLRINEALAAHGQATMEAVSQQAVDVCGHEAASAGFNLRSAVEWASVFTDEGTLGGLLMAYGSGAGVPGEVGEEVEALLAAPLSHMSGYETPSLGELIDELLSEAKDPRLLLARECSRTRPTLETLGQERGVTRERVRQIVAGDVKSVRGLLASERFRAVQWAAEQLRAGLGLVIPSESDAVGRWKARLGERRFEILGELHRWSRQIGHDGRL